MRAVLRATFAARRSARPTAAENSLLVLSLAFRFTAIFPTPSAYCLSYHTHSRHRGKCRSKVQGSRTDKTAGLPRFRNSGTRKLFMAAGRYRLRGQKGSIRTPLLFSWTDDYFFSLLTGSLLMGSVFSFFVAFISVPMDPPALAMPSLSAVSLSILPVPFKPLDS